MSESLGTEREKAPWRRVQLRYPLQLAFSGASSTDHICISACVYNTAVHIGGKEVVVQKDGHCTRQRMFVGPCR